jgi:hypothetical protein
MTMYSTGCNDRAAKVTFEYATPGASWDELAYEEKNRWRNIAFAARVAAGDVKVADLRPSKPGFRFRDLDIAG